MKYGRHNQTKNYGLEQLQKNRDIAEDSISILEAQKEIDAYFFGVRKNRKSKKERRRERRRDRQRMREEDYG